MRRRRCDNGASTTSAGATTPTTSAPDATTAPAPAPDLTAADLRATLEFQLQEHVYLAGLATYEALAGRTDGFDAAAAALDANRDDLTVSIALVYGDAAGNAFGGLGKKHIGFFVDHATALIAAIDAQRPASRGSDPARSS
jgi:hypothetical protein